MPANRAAPWILCYDIADPKRLQRVHRAVVRHAMPFQYSIFQTVDTRAAIEFAVNEIAQHIHPECDDLRAYPLVAQSRNVLYGRRLVAPDVSIPQLAIDFGEDESWISLVRS